MYAKSPNGYMDAELFTTWMRRVFIPDTSHLRPTLLIFDGHASHITIDVIDIARENNVILYCLPPHTTNILQPLDVAIFRPMKQHFSRLCGSIQLATIGQPKKVRINKTNFTAIFKEAFGSITLSTIENGFRKCGIVPLNKDAIDKTKLLDSRSLLHDVEDSSKTIVKS